MHWKYSSSRFGPRSNNRAHSAEAKCACLHAVVVVLGWLVVSYLWDSCADILIEKGPQCIPGHHFKTFPLSPPLSGSPVGFSPSLFLSVSSRSTTLFTPGWRRTGPSHAVENTAFGWDVALSTSSQFHCVLFGVREHHTVWKDLSPGRTSSNRKRSRKIRNQSIRVLCRLPEDFSLCCCKLPSSWKMCLQRQLFKYRYKASCAILPAKARVENCNLFYVLSKLTWNSISSFVRQLLKFSVMCLSLPGIRHRGTHADTVAFVLRKNEAFW